MEKKVKKKRKHQKLLDFMCVHGIANINKYLLTCINSLYSKCIFAYSNLHCIRHKWVLHIGQNTYNLENTKYIYEVKFIY